MPTRTLPSSLTSAILLLLLLGACAAPAAVAPAGATAAPSPPPELRRYYDQHLAFGPCAPGTPSARGRAPGCATLEVPLDYARPDGPTARIAVLRVPARGERAGALVVNPGGPGGSGVGFAAGLGDRLAGSPISERFDLVGFDPRGVGASEPAIRCLTDAERDAERATTHVDPSPAGVERAEAGNRRYAERCTERSGGPEVLASMGTRDVARDMDVLRSALGETKLTYLGVSYGTRLGAAYADAFPGNVRAMVLDGAVDPAQGSVDREVAQTAGYQRAFDLMAADCAGDPDCPLGTDPARSAAVFRTIVRPLIDRPAPTADGRGLTYDDAVTAVVSAVGGTGGWSSVRDGLAELRSGRGDTLLGMADGAQGRGPDGHYGASFDANLAISCMDEERLDRGQQAELARRSQAASPITDSGRGAVGARDLCAFWPAAPTLRPHVPDADGLPPTLVVSVTGDPTTPHRSGVRLAEELRGSLLTVDGMQHGAALTGNSCVDDAVADYVVELRTPPPGARCPL